MLVYLYASVCRCRALLVVLDHRANSSSDTGRFELIYRATANPNTKGCDTKFVVEGQRITKLDLQRYVAIDRRLMRQAQQAESHGKLDNDEDATTSSTAEAAGHRRSNNISLIQTTDTDTSEPRHSSLQEPRQCSQSAHATSASPERAANSSSQKTYRGLRQSTVQIYNGR